MTKHPREHLLQKTRRFKVRNRISYKGKMRRNVKSSHKNWGLEWDGKKWRYEGERRGTGWRRTTHSFVSSFVQRHKAFFCLEKEANESKQTCAPWLSWIVSLWIRKCVVKNQNVLLVIKGVKEHRGRNLPSCLSFGAQSPGWVMKITLPNVREMKSDPKQDLIFVPESANIKDIQIPPWKDETKRLNTDKHIREEFNVTSPLKCNLLKTSIPRSRHSWESQRGAWPPKCKTRCCRQQKTSVKDTRFGCALNHWT